ncbi:sugar porter family MFS transporter [Marivirga arenosa]|uniref:Sugar porter family MFS transporter n=1 Tax=Marivirga arenosa TaxID=3059076 RepID=A0AA51NAC2_9BACT|nr:sugar porter family MFS transporter [Marivirga sp. ABR2-2]WMN07425.1 sugar porter family MFS transporter [Marivirga sp. ABR2-2]
MFKNSYVFFISLTAALGGFLFGFDTAVISGAEQAIQTIWELSDWMHGFSIAIALYGTVIGALAAGAPANKYGRKPMLLLIGVLYTVSALGSALAPEVISFMVFRFIGGIGVGASSVIAPMYISEIAPAGKRGGLVALFQFNIVLGILVAYFSNYLIALADLESSWRWMLAVEVFPALIYSVLSVRLPRSPRWLIANHDNYEDARVILTKTDPENVNQIINNIEIEKAKEEQELGFFALFKKQYFKFTFMAILIAFFNQLSGINAIIYFAPRIFESAGISTENGLLSTMGIGFINVIATMFGLYLIDKMGRKFLLYLGSAGYLISLSLMAISFSGDIIPSNLLPFFVFLFIAAHAVGSGSIIWAFIAEIFPNKLRANGQSIGSFTHWLFAAIIANVFPFFANTFGSASIFWFFALMMLIQLLWAIFIMPETKGKQLEDIN